MGLDCSHGAFSGAYSAFNRFRKHIAGACGGSFPPHRRADLERIRSMSDYDGEEIREDLWYFDPERVPAEHHNAMSVFMLHSDCGGSIAPWDCEEIAHWLDWCAPSLPTGGSGHLGRLGVRGTAVRFADGCRAAAAAGDGLRFE